MYKILLIDDEEIFATTLRTVLGSLPDHQIVATITNVDKIREDVLKYQPDIIVMRTFFSFKNTGFDAAALVKQEFPEIRILMMLDMAKHAQVEAAIKAKVDCCVLRTSKPSEFVSVLWSMMKGEHIYPKFSHSNMWGPFKVGLTDREQEIILQLCRNQSYDAIAAALGVSKRTVTFHISNILSKTGHRNATGLLLEAAHKGYILNWFTDAEDYN